MKKVLIVLLSFMTLFMAVSCTQPYEKPMDNLMTDESSMFDMEEIKNIRIKDQINIRSGPSEKNPVIGELKKNDIADVLGQVGKWYVIKTPDNQVGCVSSDYSEPIVREGDAARNPAPAPAPAPDTKVGQGNQPGNNTQYPTIPNMGDADTPAPNDLNGNNTTGNNPTPNTTTPNENPQLDKVYRLKDQEQQMVTLVNQERTKNGLEPLKVDLEVTRVARIKSEDLVKNDYFSHYSPTYGSPFDMLKNFGVDYLYAGENLAGNSTVQRAHDALMKSTGHRENILNSDYTHVGIGIQKSDKYGYMFTQMFIGKPE